MTQDEIIQALQSENKAKQFEKKKEIRKEIIDFAETADLPQLTEVYIEIKRLKKI